MQRATNERLPLSLPTYLTKPLRHAIEKTLLLPKGVTHGMGFLLTPKGPFN